MPKLQVTLFVILLLQVASLLEALPTTLQLVANNNNNNNNKPFHDQETLSVFEPGTLPTKSDTVEESDLSSPPKPLLIVKPIVAGNYPVVVFLHGTCLQNYFYSDLLEHISSHGYIIVAPQLYSCIPMLPITGPAELNFAAQVANWLTSGLQSVLPTHVKGDLNKLAIGGHSRGGKMAFGLALGYAKTPLELNISALIGLDPVEGSSKDNRIDPKILTYTPNSFNLSIPVAVIGTGLGNQSSCWLVCPACAPNEVNHEEFYNECKAPASHFVATDYGHMDMLNDNLTGILGIMANTMCKNSNGPRGLMRRTVGGIFVAFLKAYFFGENLDYITILQEPSVAPAKLDPVQFLQTQNYAQV